MRKKELLKAGSFLSIILSLILSSCKDVTDTSVLTEQGSVQDAIVTDSKQINLLFDDKSNLKRAFAKSLVKSMNQSVSLRKLIRDKSLEMFDEDYDVLFEEIKNTTLENGKTVGATISQNLEDGVSLTLITKSYPTLTIFVPELPDNSFSPSSWDVETQSPLVAIKLSSTNHVPIVDFAGKEVLLNSKYIPGGPIVVIKDNERIVIEPQNINVKGARLTGDIKYRFLDDCFDHKSNLTKANSLRNKSSRVAVDVDGYTIHPKVQQAYLLNQGGDGWQRDYIYYDLSPNASIGTLNYDFQEHVTFFKFNDAQQAYNKIADDSNDPMYTNNAFLSLADNQYYYNEIQSAGWTGGSYEFKIKALVNARNGIGAEITKWIGLSPTQLFKLNYTKFYPFWLPSSGPLAYYRVSSIESRYVDLNLPFFTWDLNNYATTVKYTIEEVDVPTTITTEETTQSTFATNFSADDALKKIGIKFGASYTQTLTSKYTKTITPGNDVLGEVVVNFADKVVTSINDSWELFRIRDYNAGYCTFSVEPRKVQ